MNPSSEAPPNPGETVISYFENARSTRPASIKLGILLDSIRGDTFTKQVGELRELRQRDKEAYSLAKKNLPGFTLSGEFGVRRASGLKRHSGLLQIDVDDVEAPERLRDTLAQDPHICAAFLSPSGAGVKGVMLIPPDPARHKESFLAAESYLQERYGITIDRACKDVCRLCFVSHDPDLRINPTAVPLELPEPEGEQAESQELFDIAKLPDPMYADQGDDETAERLRSALEVLSAEDYEPWIRVGHALKGWDGPGAFELWHSWSGGRLDLQGPPGLLEPLAGVQANKRH